MREIPLRDRTGKIVAIAKVDDDDYPWLHEYNWCLHKTGYAVRNTTIRKKHVDVEGNVSVSRLSKTYYMQREVLKLKPTDRRVGDHKNEDKLDNRKENLQPVPRWMNGYGNLPQKNGAHPALGHVE